MNQSIIEAAQNIIATYENRGVEYADMLANARRILLENGMKLFEDSNGRMYHVVKENKASVSVLSFSDEVVMGSNLGKIGFAVREDQHGYFYRVGYKGFEMNEITL